MNLPCLSHEECILTSPDIQSPPCRRLQLNRRYLQPPIRTLQRPLQPTRLPRSQHSHLRPRHRQTQRLQQRRLPNHRRRRRPPLPLQRLPHRRQRLCRFQELLHRRLSPRHKPHRPLRPLGPPRLLRRLDVRRCAAEDTILPEAHAVRHCGFRCEYAH